MLAAMALAGCGSDESSSASSTDSTTDETTTTAETETTTTTEAAKPTVVSIVIVKGVPKDGIVRDVAAGGTARLPFTASLPGRFEVELEDHGVQIAELTVNA